MNLIIFGAGASYGSDVCYVPPLGNKLFNALTAFDPNGWGKLPQKYQELLQNDFEQECKDYQLSKTLGCHPYSVQWRLISLVSFRVIVICTVKWQA